VEEQVAAQDPRCSIFFLGWNMFSPVTTQETQQNEKNQAFPQTISVVDN
jgi:hypothetical protein